MDDLTELEYLRLYQKQVELIHVESATALVGVLFTTFFFSYVLYNVESDISLFIWAGLITLIYMGRFLVERYYYRDDSSDLEDYIRWERLFTIFTLFGGLCWGVGAYILIPGNPPIIQALAVLTVGGMALASVITYSSSRFIAVAYIIPSMIPLAMIFFDDMESHANFSMGMLVLLFMMVMLVSNRKLYKEVTGNIILSLHNNALIEHLKESNRQANDLNKQLENKVYEVQNLARKMTFQASHDMLTGLINRHEFEKKVKKAINSAKNQAEVHCMCYMDLDEFKIINDTCGHIAGDELLKKLSRYLSGMIRSTDTFARLGGDEFGLLLPSCKMVQAHQLAEHIRDAIQDFKFSWEDKVFDLGVSIGLVEITEKSDTLGDILKAADSACYVAKDLGRNRIHIYEENDLAVSARFSHMECMQRIQKSLAEDKFTLYFQEIRPVNNTKSDIWHGEILLRMLDENDNVILPGVFVPSAERYHLMENIDKWVVKNSFDYIKQAEQKYNGNVLCSINLSGQSICEVDFLEFIIKQMEIYGISPGSVCFEITETAAISNIFHAERLLNVLTGMGCSFALDDFGSGLSSFGYLKKLKVDYLKIDGSFVKTMLLDDKDFAMVKSINQVGKEMGMKTIAEFVQSDEIMNKLKELGVDFVQGYGVGKPIPVKEYF